MSRMRDLASAMKNADHQPEPATPATPAPSPAPPAAPAPQGKSKGRAKGSQAKGKHSDRAYRLAGAYLRRDQIDAVQKALIDLKRRKRFEFSELVGVLLDAWLADPSRFPLPPEPDNELDDQTTSEPVA